MNRQDLEDLEKKMMELVVTRRKLGGYNSEAEGVLFLSESVLQIIQHLKERAPRPQK